MPFDAFIGNSRVIERLRTKLRQDRFPHGLIFSGPEGIGKHTCALMVAKALNCTEKGPDDFCDICAQCHKINARTHPDVLQIGIDEDASEIKIAQIRQVLHMLDFQPLEGRNKVFIIDPANMMKPAAANALLKGLEEPPDHSVLILTSTNVHELMLTVRSRCQTYHFTPVAIEELRRMGDADELIIRWARGSVGLLRTLDADALKLQRDVILSFLETASGAGESEFRGLLAASGDFSRSKHEFGSHLVVLSVLLGDLLYLSENTPESVVNIDIRERLEALTKKMPPERLIGLSEFLRLMENSLKNYVNRQMLTDVLALTANDTVAKILNDNGMKSR
jgi:DNA polymerase III delta' subunit